jgi:hypothetical protein
MWTWLTGSFPSRTDLLPDVSTAAADTNACKEVVMANGDRVFSEVLPLAGVVRAATPRHMLNVIPGMNAIAFTREERPLGRVSKDGRAHGAEQRPSRLAEGGELLRMTAGYVASQPFIADTRLISSSTLDRNSFSGGEALAL